MYFRRCRLYRCSCWLMALARFQICLRLSVLLIRCAPFVGVVFPLVGDDVFFLLFRLLSVSLCSVISMSW